MQGRQRVHTAAQRQFVVLKGCWTVCMARAGPRLTQREVPAVDELCGWLIMLGRRQCAAIDGVAIRGTRGAAGQLLTTRRAPAEGCLAEPQALATDAGRLSHTARTCNVDDPHHACRHDTSVASA